jgi:hypothetical protein
MGSMGMMGEKSDGTWQSGGKLLLAIEADENIFPGHNRFL